MPRAGLDTAAVVAAAARLADEQGLDGVTLARLASELGVRPPSLYAHVDGLEDVRRRLGARGATELATAMSHAVEGRSGREALEALAHAYRAHAHEHPGTYEAAQRARELQGDEEAEVAAEAAVRVALAVLRAYGLGGDDAIHAVRIVRTALHGFVSLEAAGGFAMAQSIDETFERLVELLDLGLTQAAPGGAGGATP
jgi:AcrR family transcriptional regulator